MKRNSMFIMQRSIEMVQWHRSFRSEQIIKLWTQQLMNHAEQT